MRFTVVCACLLVISTVKPIPLPTLLDSKDIINIHGDMDIPITLEQAENEVLKLPANKRKKIDKFAYFIFVEYMQELMKSAETTTPANEPVVATTNPLSSTLRSAETGKDGLVIQSTKQMTFKADIDASNGSISKPIVKPPTQQNTSLDISYVTVSKETDVEVNTTNSDLSMTSTLTFGVTTTVQSKDTPSESDDGGLEISGNQTVDDKSNVFPNHTTTATNGTSGRTNDTVGTVDRSVNVTTIQYEISTDTTPAAPTETGELKINRTSTTEKLNVSTANVTQEATTNDSSIANVKGSSTMGIDMLHANGITTEPVTLTTLHENATQYEKIKASEIENNNETYGNASSNKNEFQIMNSAETSVNFSKEVVPPFADDVREISAGFSNSTSNSTRFASVETFYEETVNNITFPDSSHGKESDHTDIDLTHEANPVISKNKEVATDNIFLGRSSTRPSISSSSPINEITVTPVTDRDSQLEWDGI